MLGPWRSRFFQATRALSMLAIQGTLTPSQAHCV